MIDGENAADFTVYDLAERIAAGQKMTKAAESEVLNELVRVRNAIYALDQDLVFFLDTPQEEAQELLRIRAELKRILRSSSNGS